MIEDNDVIFADFDELFQCSTDGNNLRQRSISAPNERELNHHPGQLYPPHHDVGIPNHYGSHVPPPGYYPYPPPQHAGARQPMYPNPYHYKGGYHPYHAAPSPYMYGPPPGYYPPPPQPYPGQSSFQPPLHYPPAHDQSQALQLGPSFDKEDFFRAESSSSSSANPDAGKAQQPNRPRTNSEPKLSPASALLPMVSPSLPPDQQFIKSSMETEMDEANKKPMTREQFYKIRPKLPRIAKGDPRRSYAAAFGEAYNSCDFEKIWEFVSSYCTKDILFVHRWVGSELYLNFPKYLEVRGLESVSEYWFSRCVIVPDLVLEMKETKLYVRSDGISTVLSSFTIVCTRLYDGEVSDSLICRPHAKDFPSEVSLATVSETDSKSGDTDDEATAEKICNRVFNKLNKILLEHTTNEKRKGSSEDLTKETKRRKYENDTEFGGKIDLFEGTDMTFSDSSVNTEESSTPRAMTTTSGQPARIRMPTLGSITLLGTVTLHLNTDQKIRQIDLTFALQQ